ncbi:hypothetical protein Bhyg_03191 [Pseudolycoriella hygida]|uniref:Uncharacterized protein n=1 Tax=Pseudolycoriella hygida TaxID=35572 RepID=A0A9Q0NCV2_9DIPT|nr:hypothetical protein Bhyg_03191 [Pseudolycoriella hygida]
MRKWRLLVAKIRTEDYVWIPPQRVNISTIHNNAAPIMEPTYVCCTPTQLTFRIDLQFPDDCKVKILF